MDLISLPRETCRVMRICQAWEEVKSLYIREDESLVGGTTLFTCILGGNTFLLRPELSSHYITMVTTYPSLPRAQKKGGLVL